MWEYEINADLNELPLGSAGGFETFRVGKNTTKEAESVNFGQIAGLALW